MLSNMVCGLLRGDAARRKPLRCPSGRDFYHSIVRIDGPRLPRASVHIRGNPLALAGPRVLQRKRS